MYLRDREQRGLNFCGKIRDIAPFFVVQKYSVRSIKWGAFIDLQNKIKYRITFVLWSRYVNYA
jgi:hypothetical protein